MAAALFASVLGIVVAERGLELYLTHRHVAALQARGGVLVEDDGYGALVLVHVAALLGLGVEYARAPWAGAGPWTWPLLAVAAGAFALRYWVMRTLGDRWATRVVVLPGVRPVTGGPYRWVRHPNYVAVVVELLAIPLAFGCVATAVVASAANASALRRRIRIEELALRGAGGYDAAFEGKRRFVP